MLSNIQGTKLLRMKLPVVRLEWEEEPFEWTYPYSFGVVRTYKKAPIDEMRVQVNFDLLDGGGTRLRYQTWIKTDNIFAILGVPFAIGVVAKSRFEKAFRLYDHIASKGNLLSSTKPERGLGPSGRSRFKSMSETVLRQGTDASLVTRLEEFLDQADDLSLQHIRPYSLADAWGVSRRAVLEMFLRATRAGILDMSWDLLCPSCRGISEGIAIWQRYTVTHTVIPVRLISR